MNPANKRKIMSALHWIGVVGNLALAMLTIFSAYGGMIDPELTAIGAIAAMLFPGFLMITGVVTLINLIWFRKQAIINSLSIIACIGPILTLCPLNLFRPSVESIERSGERVITVMTYNILNFERYTPIVSQWESDSAGNPALQYLLDQNVDIAVCQEAEDLGRPGLHGVTAEQLRLLDERYPYKNVTRRGMAILSKYPFKRVPVCVADPNQLDLYRYDVDIDGRTLHLFSAHMQSIGLNSDDKALYRNLTEGSTSIGMDKIRMTLLSKLAKAFKLRAFQAQDVRNALDMVDGMVLLCGDFNDIPGSYTARVIESDDMTDAYSHAGLGPSITYHADRFFFRIDHMFYRGPIEALRVWRGECMHSDHYPLIGIYRIDQPDNNQPDNNQPDNK